MCHIGGAPDYPSETCDVATGSAAYAAKITITPETGSLAQTAIETSNGQSAAGSPQIFYYYYLTISPKAEWVERAEAYDSDLYPIFVHPEPRGEDNIAGL